MTRRDDGAVDGGRRVNASRHTFPTGHAPLVLESDTSKTMQFDGTTAVPAERRIVWNHLTDPEVLTSCVMGAEDVSRVSEREYEGVITQRVGGVTVSMTGAVLIEELDRPDWLAFSGHGSDSRTGSRMDADVAVTLSDADGATELAYEVDVRFTGTLATLGSRVLRRQVKTNVDAYFDNLVSQIEADL